MDNQRYYHLSLNINNLIDKFYPRIPDIEKMVETENREMKRICLSNSIENCLSAVWWGASHLRDSMNEDFELLIRVYEFDLSTVNKKNIITSDELYKKDFVRDAFFTNEIWVINENIVPVKTYIINLLDFTEESVDDLSYEDMLLFEENPEIHYDEVWNGGVFTKITNIEYNLVENYIAI